MTAMKSWFLTDQRYTMAWRRMDGRYIWGIPRNGPDTGTELTWAQVIQHGDGTVHQVTNNGTEWCGEVFVSIFNNIWGCLLNQVSVWETSNLLCWSFSFLARVAAENEQACRGSFRLVFSQHSFQLVPFSISQLWLQKLINVQLFQVWLRRTNLTI